MFETNNFVKKLKKVEKSTNYTTTYREKKKDDDN